MRKSRNGKVKLVIKEHIVGNAREYIIIALLFIIGIFLGVLFVNQLDKDKMYEVSTYINNFTEKMKTIEQLNNLQILKESIIKSIIFTIAIWFFGTTVIGIPIVFGLIIYKGFCLGYTVSICIFSMGIAKGLGFVFSCLFLQNVISIPAILALAVSGFKLYKSIIKDKRRENIKIEIARHTIFSVIMLGILIGGCLIEAFICNNMLKWFCMYT